MILPEDHERAREELARYSDDELSARGLCRGPRSVELLARHYAGVRDRARSHRQYVAAQATRVRIKASEPLLEMAGERMYLSPHLGDKLAKVGIRGNDQLKTLSGGRLRAFRLTKEERKAVRAYCENRGLWQGVEVMP